MEKDLSSEFISSAFTETVEKQIIELLLEGKTAKEIVSEIVQKHCKEMSDDKI